MLVLTIKGRDNRYVDGAEAEARRSVESTSWGKIPSYLRVLWSNNDSFSRAAKSARSHGVSPSTKIDLLFSPVIDLVSHPSLRSIPSKSGLWKPPRVTRRALGGGNSRTHVHLICRRRLTPNGSLRAQIWSACPILTRTT